MTPEFILKIKELVIAAMAAGVLLAAEHVTPWERLFGRKVEPPWSYVAGVSGLTVPFAVLLAWWQEWWSLAAWLAVICCGGGAVIVGYDVRMRLEIPRLRAELSRTLKLAGDLIKEVRRGGDEVGEDSPDRPS